MWHMDNDGSELKAVDLVYGDTFRFKVNNKEASDRGVYQYQIIEGLQLVEAAVDNKGYITPDASGDFINVKTKLSGIVKIAVRRIGDDDYKYADEEVIIPINIKKKKITIKSDIKASKIYNKNSTVFLQAEDFQNLEVDKAVDEDIISIVSAKIVLNSENAGNYNCYEAISELTLNDNNNEKYEVTFSAEGKTVDVTVEQRIIKLKVEGDNIQRQFGKKGIYENNNIPKIVITESDEKTGLIDGDNIDTINVKVKDTTEEGKVVGSYQESLKPDFSEAINKTEKWQSDNTTSNPNYKFSEIESDHIKGTLEIVREEINSTEFIKYIEFSNPNSESYYDSNSNKIWVRGTTEDDISDTEVTLSVNKTEKGKFYDSVKIKDQEGIKVSQKGNKVIFYAESEAAAVEKKVEVILYKDNKECSEPFTIGINIDAKPPVASFKQDEKEVVQNELGSLIKKISFGYFSKVGVYYEVPVEIKDEGGCGGVTWQYAIVGLKGLDEKDTKTLQEIVDGLSDWESPIQEENYSIPILDKQEDNYSVIFVRVKDRLNNSKIYASNGMVLENNEPDILFPSEGKGISEYYNIAEDLGKIRSQSITILEKGVTDGEIVSGIKNVSYEIYRKSDQKILQSGDLIVNEIPINKDNEIKGFEYEDLNVNTESETPYVKSAYNINFELTKDYDANDIYLKIKAEDFSGNMPEKEVRLLCDFTRPEISVEYQNEQTPEGTMTTVHNDKYFDGNRTAIITFSDLNLSMNESKFVVNFEDSSIKNITCNLNDFFDVNTLKELKDVKGNSIFKNVEVGTLLGEEGERKTNIIKLTFNGEDHYSGLKFSCVDEAGNNNLESEVKYTGVAATDFVIDKTVPEWDIAYIINDQKLTAPLINRVYTNSKDNPPIKCMVNIRERNFTDKDVFIISSETISEAGDSHSVNPDLDIHNLGKWELNQNGASYEWKYQFDFINQSNYIQNFSYTDLAGHEIKCTGNQFTIDWTAPVGSIRVEQTLVSKLLDVISFGGFRRFFNYSVKVDFTGEDTISPVDVFQYKEFSHQQDISAVKSDSGWMNIPGGALGEQKLSGGYTKNPDQQFVTYTKIVDRAGNETYYGSKDGVVLDTTKPGPTITITNLSQSQNGIFNEDVQLRIDVEDPIQGDTYSGLEKVWYTVSASGNVTASQETVLMDNSSNWVQGNRVFSQTITIPAKVYNSNDVRVKAYATDFTGNTGKSAETQLKIDVTNPSISVTWDLNAPANGKYYKDTRTATVTVTERNFDPNGVRFNITNTDGTSAQINGWGSSSNIGISDSATSTCTVSFPADGDYTFTLGCTDLAGNSVEYGQTNTFTIDKTIPVITVSYDNNTAKNGNYYKEKRTATVTVKEHNFNASDVKAAITANLQGHGITAPSVSGFSNSGDMHTATVDYLTDGDYTFDISYSDLAGNAASAYSSDKFTVDLTPPDVQIVDIEDKSANNDIVAPGVTYTDINFEEKGAVITLMGANNGVVTLNQVQSAIPNGQSIKLEDFPHTEAMDDLYTYKVKVEDKAGNVTEKSVMFSVNRYGSVYVLDTETKKWLSTGENDYTYINEEKSVGVIEYNVDTVDVSTLTSNRDGNLTNLKAGTDYKVKESGSEAQWKEYYYQIGAENFVEEGNYTLMISSQDKANNITNNTSVKHIGKELPLAFTVDKTAPTVVVSGVEDGGQYRSAKRIMTVDAKDNLSLAEVEIAIDGKNTVYDAEELYKTDGIISVNIGRSNKWQTIEIKARDAAGNDLGTSKSEDGELASKSAKVVMAVLVTPNVLVQYYMNKPAFFGSLGVVVLAAVLIILLILKSRKE